MTEKKEPTIADVLQAITGIHRDVSGLWEPSADMKQAPPGLRQTTSSLREELDRLRRDMMASFDRPDAITDAIRDDLARWASKDVTGQ